MRLNCIFTCLVKAKDLLEHSDIHSHHMFNMIFHAIV